MYNTEKIIDKFRIIHGNKYDYSKVNFVKTTIKVCIICPEHGEFWQEPHAHLKGQGCPKCGMLKKAINKTKTLENFISDAKSIHGNKYDYSKVEYINNKTKVIITCPIHGDFEITPNAHTTGDKRGCPKCGNTLKGSKLNMGKEKFIKKAQLKHNNFYNYDKVEYINSKTKIIITCPIHGDFLQIPYIHLNGCGCPKCVENNKNILLTNNFNINNTPLITENKNELYNYISNIIDKNNIIKDDISILNNDKLDLYIPSKNIAFDFDSLYYNSEINKPNKNYHLNKTNKCEENGIQLIHIFEDEWIYKNEICKSRIKNLLGCSERIYARKCKIIEMDKNISKNFFIKNHIQGNVSSLITYGLEYNNEIVAAMSFGKLRKNLGNIAKEGHYELLRFCNKINYNVIGGADKLFKHFIKKFKPEEIISYADRRWSIGNLYEKLNFTLSHLSEPSYFYIIGNERKNRFGFRKDVLIQKYGCLPNDTEHNFCFNKGWYRIYDCGTKVYKWKNLLT